MEPYQTERFRLSAGPAAAAGYPMEVVGGYFLTSDGNGFPVSPGFLEGDWGLSHVGYAVGNAQQPAPDSLRVRWFSYAEDKFYEGGWSLPQHRIHDLLKQGFWDSDESQHKTYRKFTLCLLPGGVGVVWLRGDQMQTLIGRYRGREIAYDFRQFNPGAPRHEIVAEERGKLPAAVQAEIQAGTLGPQRWDEYLKTYPWQAELIEGPDRLAPPRDPRQPVPPPPALTVSRHYSESINAEQFSYPLTQDGWPAANEALLTPRPKPVPKMLGFFARNRHGEQLEIRVDPFDEAETLAAFRALHRADPQAPITLTVALDPVHFNRATLALRTQWQSIPLEKATVKVFHLKR